MGLLASAERDYTSALVYFKKTSRLYPMNPGALFNAGQMLLRLRDPEQARVYLTRHRQTVERLNQIYPLKAAASRPDADSATWTKLGNAYLQVGMQAQAREAPGRCPPVFSRPSCRRAPARCLPGAGERPSKRGQEHRDAGRLDEAIDAFRTAYEQAFGNPEPLVGITEIQMSTRSWRDALETAKSLTRGFPELARGRFLRASCLTRLGRYAGARRWVQRTLDIDPAHAPALELLDHINRLEEQRENRD